MRRRRQATDDLRLAIACLPRATRVAMLAGLAENDIIVGAYSTGEGICPMLAAHRAGGRTDFIGFAEAWDRYAQRTRVTRRPRPATERELLVLRTHLEASLLEDTLGARELGAAIAEHRALVSRRRLAGGEVSEGRVAGRARRPGDPDRRRELRGVPGWSWMRLFRRYDEYERALAQLSGDETAAERESARAASRS